MLTHKGLLAARGKYKKSHRESGLADSALLLLRWGAKKANAALAHSCASLWACGAEGRAMRRKRPSRAFLGPISGTAFAAVLRNCCQGRNGVWRLIQDYRWVLDLRRLLRRSTGTSLRTCYHLSAAVRRGRTDSNAHRRKSSGCPLATPADRLRDSPSNGVPRLPMKLAGAPGVRLVQPTLRLETSHHGRGERHMLTFSSAGGSE